MKLLFWFTIGFLGPLIYFLMFQFVPFFQSLFAARIITLATLQI